MKFSACAPLVVLAAAVPVHAQQAASRPDAMVKHTVEDVMSAVSNDSAANAGDLEKIRQIVEQKFLPSTDFLHTTRLAVGSSVWNKATPDQQKALFEQFQKLLVRTYATQLSQTRGQNTQFKFPPMTQVPPGTTDAVVRTQVVASGETMNIDYRVEKSGEAWKIYDINMMGAWMIPVYQKQFAQQVSRGGVDGLIKFLQAHNKQE